MFLLLADLWEDNGIEEKEGNGCMSRMKQIPYNVAIVGRWQEADRGWRLLILKSQEGFNIKHEGSLQRTKRAEHG